MSQEWTPPPAAETLSKVPNNLVLAIVASVVSLLACCIPHGLISLIFALQVDKKAAAGDIAGATNSAKQARLWALISIILAVVGGVIAVVFGLFGAIISIISAQ
jgi:Interferon-induced transmembrane protein